mmetsp:Transcript_53223/g.57767  ORF Transcript_53223/g.57767 Transcript_53223/m.57767 type:complete len:140 (-) Transcript_53223:584-1003(-)
MYQFSPFVEMRFRFNNVLAAVLVVETVLLLLLAATTNNKSGKEAIREWEPHLIYVQGGNTFWLHHCMEKGDWTQDLIDACCCNSNDATNTDQDSSPLPPSLLSPFSAVYCGVSAGAILAGQHLQTASWKVRNRYIYKRD